MELDFWMQAQVDRRTCATHMEHLGNIKDAQAHLRHARPNVTVEVYTHEIPASVRSAVELLDQKLSSQMNTETVGRSDVLRVGY
jgi:hypothetical protein